MKILFHTLLVLLTWTAIGLGEGAPTENVKQTVDKVLAILNNPRLKPASKTQERREQLREAIYSRFDFQEMARRSLGTYWRQRSPAEQKEFVQLFTDLLERAYLGRVETYNDENFAYVGEKLDGSFAEVDSKIITRKGDELSLNYKLHLVNDDWKVYDVVVENISLVNNYRSQFSRVLGNSSFEELMRRLKEKQAEAASK